ncbi:uncharacterized protein DS421_13g403310 [Arachis hypogaea]|nr:uncharacterized protein DS421_13g403310 [Arachis hypogaea]
MGSLFIPRSALLKVTYLSGFRCALKVLPNVSQLFPSSSRHSSPQIREDSPLTTHGVTTHHSRKTLHSLIFTTHHAVTRLHRIVAFLRCALTSGRRYAQLKASLHSLTIVEKTSKTGKLLVKQMRKLLSLYLEKNNQVGLGAMKDLLHEVT